MSSNEEPRFYYYQYEYLNNLLAELGSFFTVANYFNPACIIIMMLININLLLIIVERKKIFKKINISQNCINV